MAATEPQEVGREEARDGGGDESRGDERDEARDDERDESRGERLDRNQMELLNELRVAGTGIQVLLAFLLVVPFDSRFDRLSSFERYDYFVALLCIAVAAVLLIAPSIHHRLLFHRRQKRFLVAVATGLMIVAMGFLAVGLVGILTLISDMMFGASTAVPVGGTALIVVVAVWFGVPLKRRRCRKSQQGAVRPRTTRCLQPVAKTRPTDSQDDGKR